MVLVQGLLDCAQRATSRQIGHKMAAPGNPGDDGGHGPCARGVFLHKRTKVNRTLAVINQGKTLLELEARRFHFSCHTFVQLLDRGIRLLSWCAGGSGQHGKGAIGLLRNAHNTFAQTSSHRLEKNSGVLVAHFFEDRKGLQQMGLG